MATHPLRLLVFALVPAAAWSCSAGPDAPAPQAGAPAPCRIALAESRVRDSADREIARLQREARAGGDAARALEALGSRYVARARLRGDEGDYALAERTADCLLAGDPGSAAALLLRGHALHQMHRFREAEAVARTLVARRRGALDYGLLGDALMEQGRLAEAAAAYQQMADIRPFYQSYVRAAHVRWLRGDLDGALDLMRLATASASPRDPEALAWAHTRVAALELQAGRLDEASRAIEAALGSQQDYPAALLARGRVQLASPRPADAVESLERAAAQRPTPEFQWALADALRAAGRIDDARPVEEALRRDGPRTDPRTTALFLATRRQDPDQAVALARRELERRSDIFTLDAVAWTLAAAGRIGEAEPFMARALAEGTEDARLFLHAAAIASAAGRRADAAGWLARAGRLRPMLLPSERDTLAALGASLSTQEN